MKFLSLISTKEVHLAPGQSIIPKEDFTTLVSAQEDLDLAHDEWLNWSGRAMSWNTMCVDCHSTDLSKNYDDATDSFNTTFSEINVSCEACHGPMSEHNSFYEKYKDDQDKTKTGEALNESYNTYNSRQALFEKEPSDLAEKEIQTEIGFQNLLSRSKKKSDFDQA